MQLLSILRMASGASLWRGLDYVEQGRVKNLRPDGKGAFDAEVEGSANLPYTVHVDTAHVRQSYCDCPHAAGTRRICKHMVATVFAAYPSRSMPSSGRSNRRSWNISVRRKPIARSSFVT